ncbi:hypothetical protein CAMGR0001_0809 [Campylobacter gracilis RM3268]|uniref:Uncharacterized protein n=1 Tax=Campylobacter gracilis RM3268 TaxID=553220 RepID=C8PG16_9BACT|nr:hypothetical protein CAMGR0001_0809 [Campylobacter gracilis RM3268]
MLKFVFKSRAEPYRAVQIRANFKLYRAEQNALRSVPHHAVCIKFCVALH